MNEFHHGSVKAARVHIGLAMSICKGLIAMPDVDGQERARLHEVVEDLHNSEKDLEVIS